MTTMVMGVVRPRKRQKSGGDFGNRYPTPLKKIGFPWRNFFVKPRITQSLQISNIFFLSLRMEIEIQNRLRLGLVFGWALYNIDEEYDYGEFILYLFVISLHVRWINELKL